MTETTPKKGNGREWTIGMLAVLLAISTGFNVRCYYLNNHKAAVPLKIETGSIKRFDPHAALKAEIAGHLTDPESVRWGEFDVINDDVVCGVLNSKNRMGGYNGKTMFVWNRKGRYKLSLASEQRFSTSQSMFMDVVLDNCVTKTDPEKALVWLERVAKG